MLVHMCLLIVSLSCVNSDAKRNEYVASSMTASANKNVTKNGKRPEQRQLQ